MSLDPFGADSVCRLAPARPPFRHCLQILVAAIVIGAPMPALAQGAAANAASAGGVVAAPAGSQANQEREKLFEQYFGKRKPQQSEKRIELPVVMDGQSLGQVPANLPDDLARATVEAKDLEQVLSAAIVQPVIDKIAKAKTDHGYIPLSVLQDAGLGARVDPLTLSLLLNVPGKLRKPEVIDLKGHGAPPVAGVGEIINPAAVSAYVNVHGNLDYIHSGQTPGLQPLALGLDGAVNLDGNFVLQSTDNYISAGGRRWQRGDTSLIHDDPADAIRYQLGDLLFPLVGFQTSQSLGGFDIARNYTLQPYTNIQPAGQQQFILTSPSKVQVDVNGRPTQVIQLPAGRYNIRNFPFAQGANNVQLTVTDSSGRTSTTTIPYFFDSTLLDAGVSQFNYAVGLPMAQNNGLRKYPLTFPSISMFHNYGFTDTVTGGVNFQGNNAQDTLGAELGAATAIGNLHFDAAGSRVRDYGLDYALEAQYSYANITNNSVSRNLIAAVTYTGRRFGTLGTTNPDNSTKLDISARYSQPLVYDIYAGLGGAYDFNRNQDNSYNFDLSLRRNITTKLSANVDLIRSFDVTGKVDNRILLTLTISFDGGRQFARSGYDSDLRSKTADWEYIPTSDLYHPYGDFQVGNSSQSTTFNGDLSYNTTRLETTLSHNETYPYGGGTSTTLQRNTSLAFGSALVFADGYAALARPVGDSFALFKTEKNASGDSFKVDPQGNNYMTRNDFFMPAVLPNLNGYEVSTAQIAVPNLPAGYDIGPETFVLQPTYHSGSLIKIGTSATVYLEGTLVGRDGKPISLISGTFKRVGAGNAKPIIFFTNRTGRFRAEGLQPGAFDMDFTGAFPGISKRITIPAKANGIYHIGTIQIPVVQAK